MFQCRNVRNPVVSAFVVVVVVVASFTHPIPYLAPTVEHHHPSSTRLQVNNVTPDNDWPDPFSYYMCCCGVTGVACHQISILGFPRGTIVGYIYIYIYIYIHRLDCCLLQSFFSLKLFRVLPEMTSPNKPARSFLFCF